MTVYNLYIFDRFGVLLHYAEWNRRQQTGITRVEEAKLMHGMLFSLKSFVYKLSPMDIQDNFLQYKTNKYKMNMLETPTGVRFVMNTDVNAVNVRDLLCQIHKQIYLEYVVMNPLCKMGKAIKSELFSTKLEEVVRQSSVFMSKPV